MDFASLIGLALALAGLVVGHTLDGGRFASLIQPAAFAIVVVGTFGAVLLQSETRTFLRGIAMLRWVFVPPKNGRQKLSREIALWSLTARRDGLLSLEQFMSKADPLRSLMETDFRQAVIDAIDKLPPREKLLMGLYYEEELNLKEIGAVMGVSESRVSQLHTQAVARLRTTLREQLWTGPA